MKKLQHAGHWTENMSTSEYNGETFTHEYYLCGRMPVVALTAEDGLWARTKDAKKTVPKPEIGLSLVST